MTDTTNPSEIIPADEYLERDQILTLKKLLEEQLERILKQSAKTVSEYTEVREREADPLDFAANEADLAFSQRLSERDRMMVRKLRYAMSRIREGEYGMCERCGDAIGYRRQLARPVATLCIDCKTTTEALERGGRRRR